MRIWERIRQWWMRRWLCEGPATFVCPSREQTPMWFGPGDDHWRQMPDGTRTCSFCGSLHPEDFRDICYGYVEGDGSHFDVTTKGYKVYASRPGTKNAMEGGIKFYRWHLAIAGSELAASADAAYRLALPIWRRKFNQRFGG
jgi:hypothetical protein